MRKRSKKLKLSNKITASIVMILQVMNTFSADLVVDPNSRYRTTIDRSANGVPIVNISTPNAHGISVNDFLEYNVGEMGQVINNSDNVGRSHLAGLINGNPNFGANQAANLIVMQVNGANRSNIEGYIEALNRQRANVILSNENGIFLNGAGTINIKNFIPTTGKVKLKDGDFVGIDVTKGNVVIGDKGFDAKNTDYVAIISKVLGLQGKLVAKNLEILAGENSVNADGTFVNKTSGDVGKINLQELGFDERFKDLITVVPNTNPANPEIVIDGSLLGSMYAGQIKIIVNNKGAGVNNRGFIVSKDKKLEITADGKVKVNQVQGNGIEIKGKDYEQSSLAYSTQGIDITAKTITLNGIGTKATDNINLNGNTENTALIQTDKSLNTKDLKNSGSITVVNDLNVSNLENSSKILVGNNVNINGSNVLNSGELLSGNNINSKNVSLNNNGQIGANNKIDFDNSSVSNQHNGKITADKISMQGTKSYTNQGEIVGNETVLTSTNNLDLTGKLHGEKSLVIKGQNIRNDGETTGSENIEIIANDFTNNTEIGAENVKIFASGNVENNNILNGENLTIKAKNLENKDLIATENKLKLDVKNNLINNPNSSIYGGNLVDIKASNILNKRSEILGGDIKIEAQNARNEVGLIQGNDVFIKTNVFENIGEVKDLNKYTKYYVTWDGKRLSEDEVDKKWIVDKEKQTKTKRSNGSAGQTLRRWQRERFNNIVGKYGGEKEIKSYLLTNHLSEIQSQLEGGRKVFVAYSSEYPIKALEGKLEGDANTEYAKVIGNNVTIQANSNILNKDGIISSEDTTKLMTNTLENSVTTGDAVQLKDGQERVKIWFERTGKIINKKVHATVDYVRELKTGTLAYESGQPSIIEGQNVIITAPNIVTSSITEANGQTNVGTTENNTKKIFGKQLNKGTIETNGKVEIIGNNQDLLKIKETGTIEISPTLVSSMFRENEEPTSKYLMETRSKYVQLNNFYGSDYFLTRVGYEDRWDRVRRLGDAYYESQLITKALTERLGSQFINGKSGQDLMKQLMDNALVEKNRQNLKIGTALTKEQRRKLENDIIWYVYKNVNGVKVLAPEIYLINHTVAEINNDTRNRIGGFEKTYVSANNLENVGTKIGNKGTTIVDVSSLKNKTNTNLISEIAGDIVQITAINDIENIGGKIRGENSVELISKQGNITNETTTRTAKYYKHELDRTEHEEIASTGEISSQGTINITGNNVISKGALIDGQDVVINAKNDVNLQEITLTGEDNFGSNGDNFNRFKKIENKESNLIAENLVIKGKNLNVSASNVMTENAVIDTQKVEITAKNDVIETESRSKQKGFMKKSSSVIESHDEINKAGTLLVKNQAIITGDLNTKGSNVVLGNNSFVGGKLTTDSNELNNTYYYEEKKSGFSGSISSEGVSVGYGKSQSIYDEKGKTNAKSTLHLGDGTVLNKGAEITATNFEYGNIQINNGDVKYGTRIDTRDVHTSSKRSSFGISAGINSPILDRVKQAGNAVKQVKDGDTAGGIIEVANAIAGTVQGMSGNITKINGSRATMKDIENGDFKVNNSFYIGGNLRASFNKSKLSSDSHTESAVVTTMKPSNDNATITYNNVNNVTYQGTQAQGGTFIYNNVANIQKEAVELKNSYSSKNSSLGIGLSVGIGSKGSIKSSGISGNVSQSNGNLNIEGTNYQNGNFVNVNEVHNNTGSMTLTGFNQEGGKVTGNIEKLVVESKQNTSITAGSSRNVGVGFSGNGIPNSLNVSQNNTNGNKNYVKNQSSFIVGQGSNLQVGTLENVASIIGKQSENVTFKVNNYIGKNLENEDTMTTTGGSVGASLGQNPKITSVGFNQDSKEKEGITRNTVVGNVEIGQVSGDDINRDLSKTNETIKDVHKTTNINIEPQLIEYTSNPTKFKEDLEVAVLEGKATGETVLKSIENVVNGGKEDIGDPERRSLNEIKETVIRVKTAPEMNTIATGDLNSQEVLNSLDINAIEKFNPDDPDLPKNVRTRLDKVRRNGGEIEAFYDKTTNKIFINENVEDSKTRALVAREWKISEDLKDGKGKANDEGQLKATVAGELAYDDMMKRAGENKTRSISIDELKIGSMDIDSEITADFNNKHVDKFWGRVGSILNKVKKGDFKGAYKEAKQTKQDVTRVLKNDIKTVSKGGPVAKETIKESANATVYAVKKIVPKSKKKSTKKSPPKKKTQPKKQNSTEKVTVGERVQKVVSGGLDVVVGLGTGGTGLGLIGASGIGEGASAGVLTPVMALTATAGGTAIVVGGNKIVSGTDKIWDGLAGNAKRVRGESLNILRTGTKMVTGHPEYYDNFETLVEVGTASMAPYVPVLSNASKLSIYNAEYKKNNVLNDYPASATRPTYKQSENDLTKSLKETYKNNPDVKILSQKSYLGKRTAEYGTRGSVRPDNIKLENNIPVESFEMKNYKLQNYDNMANTIVKQVEQRRNNFPLTVTKQNIVIDARGQGITAVQEKEIIQKIIDKSNGTIKKSDITIWK